MNVSALTHTVDSWMWWWEEEGHEEEETRKRRLPD
jgi:hypothetical protein